MTGGARRAVSRGRPSCGSRTVRRGVDPAAGHAVYRAVQESLTNSARYAPGSPVRRRAAVGSRAIACIDHGFGARVSGRCAPAGKRAGAARDAGAAGRRRRGGRPPGRGGHRMAHRDHRADCAPVGEVSRSDDPGARRRRPGGGTRRACTAAVDGGRHRRRRGRRGRRRGGRAGRCARCRQSPW